MRIHAAGASAVTSPAAAPRRMASGAFSVAGGGQAQAPARNAAPRAVASLDALIALQAVDDLGDRRRRAVRRGRATLDALDDVKLGVLVGALDPQVLVRLKTAAEAAAETTGDPCLDAIMAEIGLRAAVELAKFERRGGAETPH